MRQLRFVIVAVLLLALAGAVGCGGRRQAPHHTPAPALKCNASRTVCVPRGEQPPPPLPTAPRGGGARYGLDHAWGRLTPGELRAAGGVYDIGYLSFDAGKNLSRSEIAAMSRAGYQVALVWETYADRALAGYGVGRADAANAIAQARAVGWPAGKPIYFAVDFDTTGGVGRIFGYFRGVDSVLGVARVGDYGGLATVEGLARAHLAAFHWQTLAWSPRWSARACVEQYSIDDSVAGVSVDWNRAYCDFGGWRLGERPKPKPVPIARTYWQACAALDAIQWWKRHHGRVSPQQHRHAVAIRARLRRGHVGCSRPGWAQRPRRRQVSYPFRLPPPRRGALAT